MSNNTPYTLLDDSNAEPPPPSSSSSSTIPPNPATIPATNNQDDPPPVLSANSDLDLLTEEVESGMYQGSLPNWWLRRARTQFFLWALAIATEVYLSTIPLLVIIYPSRSYGWIILTFSNPLCCCGLLFVSFSLDRRKYLKRYFEWDSSMFQAIGVAITSMAYTATSSQGPFGWRLASGITNIFSVLILAGAVRVMLKEFPWTAFNLFIYKLNRGYGVIFYIVIQLVQIFGPENITSQSAQELATQSLWIVVVLSFRTELLNKVLAREQKLKEKRRCLQDKND